MRISELCQPCGECAWCRENWRARRASNARGRELRRAQGSLRKARGEVYTEWLGLDDANPRRRKMGRLVQSIDATLARIDRLMEK